MKLHLGCGKRHLEGYINIDAVHPAADIQWENLANIPSMEAGSCDEILLIHVIEHLWPDDVQHHLDYWHLLLRKGGKLIIEAPDIYKMARNLLQDLDTDKPIFGDAPNRSVYECHKAGWSFRRLQPMLYRAGFQEVVEMAPQKHGKKDWRDFRVEATK